MKATPPSNQPPANPSFSYDLDGMMMGSTVSLVGMIKAAALKTFQSLDDAALNDDRSSSHSSSDSDAASEEPNDDDDDPTAIRSRRITSISDSTSDENDDVHVSQDVPLSRANRIALNRFASTLIHQQQVVNPTSRRHRSFVSSPVLQSNASLPYPPIPSSSSNPSTPYRSARLNSIPPITEEDSNLSDPKIKPDDQDDLRFIIDNFGPWTGTDVDGQPESESWIKQIPGILTRSVLIQGDMFLTNRRLCYIAYLPVIDLGETIRSGPVTLQSGGMFSKRTRCWVELRNDSLTQFKSSTKLYRPIASIHLSEIKHVLPIVPAQPKTLNLRLRNGKIVLVEFDTAEATVAWHNEFVGALFNFKALHSNRMKIMIPLRRIRKLRRNTFESMAKVMDLDIDCANSIHQLVETDVIEKKITKLSYDRTQIQLSYFLTYGNFDDLILDAIVRAKLEVRKPEGSSKHGTPPPLLKITTTSTSDDPKDDQREDKSIEHTEMDSTSDVHSLTNKFIKAFGLESNSRLLIYSCSLLRTLPSYGHVAISKDYLCFWHRGIRLISSDYKLRIPLRQVGKLKRTSPFGFQRFGLAIEFAGSPDIRLDFTSKSTREEVIEVLSAAVRDANLEPKRIKSPTAQPPQSLGRDTDPRGIPNPPRSDPLSVCINDVAKIPPPKLLRIVCLTIGSRGDVQPYISLAKRLMQDGHTVTIASHPEYRSWVESFGILYKDVGGDPGALMNFSVEHNFFSTGFFKDGIGFFRNWLDQLFMEAWIATRDSEAELLIESPSTFAGIHIAEALRIPYFRAFTMTWTSTATYPQAFASSIDLGPSYNLLSYSLFDNLLWRAMSRQVNKWRVHTLQIPPTSLEKMQPYKVPFMYNFSSAVVPKPLDWRDHVDVTGYWFLDQSQGDYKPSDELLKFITSAKKDKVPLIYVGFGSVTVPDSAAVTRAIYTAVVQTGVRAIVAKGWSDRIESKSPKETIEPPPEVYVLQAVPHDWLFPQLDAVCHHGGAGTTGISLRFGVPTIIHPFFGDQPFWAERVSRLGAGLRIDSLSANTLAEAFKKATSDRIMREKADQVKERIQAEDGPTRAVQFIYQYMDFATQRTLHRIERTRIKKSRTIRLSATTKIIPGISAGNAELPIKTSSRGTIIKGRLGIKGRPANSPPRNQSSDPHDDPEPLLNLEVQASPLRVGSVEAVTYTSEPETFFRPENLDLSTTQHSPSSPTFPPSVKNILCGRRMSQVPFTTRSAAREDQSIPTKMMINNPTTKETGNGGCLSKRRSLIASLPLPRQVHLSHVHHSLSKLTRKNSPPAPSP